MIHELKIDANAFNDVCAKSIEFDRHSQNVWTLTKVGYHEKSNAIRARFRNPAIGLLSGVIKPDFELKTEMSFWEIFNQIDIDCIVTNEFYDMYIKEQSNGEDTQK